MADQRNHEVIIPLSEDLFKEFVSRLLGKPQTITARFVGPFDMDAGDVENCFHVVDQRVKQQNAAHLVQFSVKLIYDDDTTVTLGSLQDFLVYKEVRPVASVGAHLSWTYLIRFKNSKVPEKQTIDLTITSESRAIPLDLSFDSYVLSRFLRGGRFFLRISHTERTWGTDIENLLSGQIKSWIKDEKGIKRAIYTYPGWVGFSVGTLFFVLTEWGAHKAIAPLRESFVVKAEAMVSASMDDKLNFLLRALYLNPASKHDQYSMLITVSAFIVALVLSVVVGSFAENPPRSFLVLSEGARRKKAEAKRERVWTWGYFVGTAVSGTIAGLASRYLFAILVGGGN